MDDTNKLMQTPKDLIQLFINKEKTVSVALFEYYEDSTIVVTVRLKFWARLWASLNSDYAYGMKKLYQIEADNFAPEGLKIEVVIVLCD